MRANNPYVIQPGIDPVNLEETGWGVIFPAEIEPAKQQAQERYLSSVAPNTLH